MAVLPDLAAFVTGSHAYGTPHEESDIDLVVLVSEADLNRLMIVGTQDETVREYRKKTWGTPLRFGGLNLLCCTTEAQYRTWRKGTAMLKQRKPVTREQAVTQFDLLREIM